MNADDIESDEPVFMLPEITVFDEAGVSGNDAHYEISKHGNNLIVKTLEQRFAML